MTSIRYGMGAIKGVGASAVEAIIEERAVPSLQEPAGLVPAHRFAGSTAGARCLDPFGQPGSHRAESRQSDRGTRSCHAARRTEFARHERYFVDLAYYL